MDKFYTANVDVLMPEILKNIDENDFLIEPSCGNGAFAKRLPFQKLYDIDETLPEVIKSDKRFQLQNFLKTTDMNATYIGNPPFGKNGVLAKKFVKHCCELNAKKVMFILPKSFPKKIFPLNYHLISSIDYNEFIHEGKAVFVECEFQIWFRDDSKLRADEVSVKALYNPFFDFISPKEAFETRENLYSIRRVGSKTPEITYGVHPSFQDHWYVRFKEGINVNKFIEKYNSLTFQLSPSTKQKHINKSDLNGQLKTKIDVNEVLP